MPAQAFALFDSPIGSCGIAWNAKGIAGFHLPLATAQATRARLQQRWAGAVESTPPAGVQRVIDRVLALLAGEAIDLSDIPVDLADAPEFHRKVYEVARTIPPGRTMTYGEIAKRLGVPHELREVGQALGAQSHRHHRALPSRAGRRRQDGRLLGHRAASPPSGASWRSRAPPRVGAARCSSGE